MTQQRWLKPHDIGMRISQKDFESFIREIYFSRLIGAVPTLRIAPDRFTMDVKTDDEQIYEGLLKVQRKIRETLDLCRSVVQKRTPYRITQERIDLNRI